MFVLSLSRTTIVAVRSDGNDRHFSMDEFVEFTFYALSTVCEDLYVLVYARRYILDIDDRKCTPL